MSDLKRCTRCKQDRPRADFNRDRSSRDGLQDRCRSCQLAANKEWRRRNPNTARAISRRNEPRRTTKVRESAEAKRAHLKVYRAVKSGRLVRPDTCSKCGRSDSRIHGHHADYSKPLEVEWLCTWCHGELHAETAAAA